MKDKLIIGTHNGVFHSDEIFAISLLALNEEVIVKRTRDEELLKYCDVLVDVGGKYDGIKYFDHHQESYTGELSSVGMVYANTNHNSTELDKFITILDRNDIGIEKSNHPAIKMIQGLNDPEDIYGKNQEGNFIVAVDYAKRFIISLLDSKRTRSHLEVGEYLMTSSPSIHNVEGSIYNVYDIWVELSMDNIHRAKRLEEERKELSNTTPTIGDNGERVIKLNVSDIFTPVKYFIGKADISIQWDNSQKCWTVQTVPLRENSFDTKYRLTAVGDENFIHKGGFISKTKSGKYNATKTNSQED